MHHNRALADKITMNSMHKHNSGAETLPPPLVQPKLKNNYAKVIAISSGKGGVGKSFLATNLAIALSSVDNSVCLFDADTNMANINILLGITPLHTLQHFLTQSLDLNDIIIKGTSGIDIIAGASGVADFIRLSQSQQQKLVQGLGTLEKDYQYLIIDTAAGVNETNISLILAASYLVLAISTEPTSLTDAFSLLKILKNYNFKRPVLVIVNMVDSRLTAQSIYKRFKDAVSQYLQIKSYLAGYVLKDDQVHLSILRQQALMSNSPESPAGKCISRISQRLSSVFEQRQHKTASFSDYFSDLMIPDELYETNNNMEYSIKPDKEVDIKQKKQLPPIPTLHHSNTINSFNNISLLRASHIARLLGKQYVDNS
jgi:MinD-like ATPase involved in chromosome partitioning or flagellar assembly